MAPPQRRCVREYKDKLNRSQHIRAGWHRGDRKSELPSLTRTSSLVYPDKPAVLDSYFDCSLRHAPTSEDDLPKLVHHLVSAEAPYSGAPSPVSDFLHDVESPYSQASPASSPSEAEIIETPPPWLCHRCSDITAESLSDELGYEHALLSELPVGMRLRQFGDWQNDSAGVCKLCLVMMNTFSSGYFHDWTLDRYRLRLFLDKEAPDEETQEQDHFESTLAGSGEKTIARARKSMSNLILVIMDLRPWEVSEDYKGRGGSYPPGTAPRATYSRRLHCFTDEHDPAVSFGVTPVRSVGCSTASEASFETAAAWLSQCLAADPPRPTNLILQRANMNLPDEDNFNSESGNAKGSFEVSHLYSPERPARLLEICCGADSGLVRLIDNTKANMSYATLSYCWGSKYQAEGGGWLTTTSTLHMRRAGTQRSDLPKTLQDSILISEKLGIKYLWIDSLCIIQDSDDDWKAEAAKMGGIYFGSVVTIVAASSSSAADGCFNRRSTSTLESLRAQDKLISLGSPSINGRTSALHIITEAPPRIWGITDLPIEDFYADQVTQGPWAKRAWTLQEHVLSRRVLFYTSRMLLWECGHCRLSEDRYPQMQGDRPYPLDLVGSGLSRGPDVVLTAETWYLGIVEAYSSRHMTFSRDKMIAIGAVARATSLGRHIPYLAGLWGDSVRAGLLWRRAGHGHKSKAAACPSWSWASQSSPVSYDWLTTRLAMSDLFEPKVLDVRVECADTRNPFGDLRSGYVMLHTKVETARVLRDVSIASLAGQTRDQTWARGIFIGSRTSMSRWPAVGYMDDEGEGEQSPDEFLVALVAWSYYLPVALLLHPPRADAGEYRRVGIVILNFESVARIQVDSHVLQWATKTIRIV